MVRSTESSAGRIEFLEPLDVLGNLALCDVLPRHASP
jgi:hypothetical protein